MGLGFRIWAEIEATEKAEIQWFVDKSIKLQNNFVAAQDFPETISW